VKPWDVDQQNSGAAERFNVEASTRASVGWGAKDYGAAVKAAFVDLN